MIRAFAVSTFVAGAFGLGVSLSAGLAAAAGVDGVAMPPGKPVQSNSSTASSGRRPLAVRIAMADKRKVEEPPVAVAADVPRVEASSATVLPAADPTVVDGTVADKPAVPTLAPSVPTATGFTVPRLAVDCEESTIDARHGESIRWRITIRNAGADAHDVLATLFLAEGIEPTAASGHGHTVASGEVRFSPVKTLASGDAIQLEVTGRAIQPAAVAYRIEVGCRDLPGHVAREAVILVRPKQAE